MKTKDIILSNTIQQKREALIKLEFDLEYSKYQIEKIKNGTTTINNSDEILSILETNIERLDTHCKLAMDELIFYKNKRDVSITKRIVNKYPSKVSVNYK